MNNYTFDENGRCLISPAIGCTCFCNYCYCIDHPSRAIADHEKIIEDVVSNPNYVEGKTIISLGCYTECLASDSILSTKKLINFFLSRGHKVSIATKQDPLLLLDIKEHFNRFYCFISCPVITSWQKLEKGTLAPEKRFSAIPSLKKKGIIPVAYIKPFLSSTEKDLNTFLKLIEDNQLDVVLGKFLSPTGDGKKINLIKKELWETTSSSYTSFKEQLEKVTTVYENSIEVLTK